MFFLNTLYSDEEGEAEQHNTSSPPPNNIMCNDAPTVDGSDSGVKRRIRMVEWVSRFVDAGLANPEQHMYARDTNLVEGFKNSDAMRLAFVKSLLDVPNA